MNIPNALLSWAQIDQQNTIEIDALNKDYWQQSQDERARRDAKKIGAISGRSFAAGALHILIDLHIEQSDVTVHFDDQLVEADILKALSDPDYAAYIKAHGILSHAAWQRSTAERAALYAIPEDAMSDDNWQRLNKLDLILGY